MKNFRIFLLFAFCLLMSGCGEPKMKDVVSTEYFSSVAVDNGFVVTLKDYSKIDYIVEAREAILNDITIEMFQYTDSKYADMVQQEHIDNFALLKSTGAQDVKKKGDNYYKYSLVSNGYYMISSRVDNTLIFCKTPIKNKDVVEALYNELGY